MRTLSRITAIFVTNKISYDFANEKAMKLLRNCYEFALQTLLIRYANVRIARQSRS